MKATEMVKKAAKWYFETAAMLYPYPDIVEHVRKNLPNRQD